VPQTLASSELRAPTLTAVALVLGWPASSAFAHGFALERELPASSAYFGIGISHILGGIDHLLFLTGLVLIGGRLRDLLAAVTAFTIAHSMTLAASVFGLVSPPASWVEVLIALSVAYVGVENLLSPGASSGRWRLTFVFGLIHGFGFAGALREIGVPLDRSAAALVFFNLGVEAGQLAVLAVAAPIILGLRRLPHMRRWGGPALSGALVMVGLIWAVTRTLAPEPAVASDATSHDASSAEASVAQSNYPRAVGAAMPWVLPLCTAFHELPRVRRAQCTGKKPGLAFTGECVRMLNAAVSSRALRIDEPGAQRCIAAETTRMGDCSFTRAASLPALAECRGVLHGSLAQGATCRSSLECDEGLHCLGVSPLDTGTCQAPRPDGSRCGFAVDPLAAYIARSADDPNPHRECAGNCVRGTCQNSGPDFSVRRR
jgi:hydrogenase/urease accessory protein HupE